MRNRSILSIFLLVPIVNGQGTYPPDPSTHLGLTERPGSANPGYSDKKSEAFDGTTVAGKIWLPDKGVMLTEMSGWGAADKLFDDSGRLDNRRTLPYNLGEDKFCVTLKFQQDYETTDETAKPGTFTWTKDAGNSGFWDIDAAIRADLWIDKFYDPRGMEASLAFGYDIKKSDSSDDEVDQQSLHLSIPFVPNDLFGWFPFLQKADQVFQADLSYSWDEVANDSGFEFETDWEPVFVFPSGTYDNNDVDGFWMGVRCDTTGKPLDPRKVPDRFFYHIDPNIGVSYGEKYSLGSPVSIVESELTATYSLGLEIGGPIHFGKHGTSKSGLLATLDYTFKGGTALTDEGSFVYHQVGFHLKPAQSENPVTFDVVYQNGKDGFSSKSKIEQVKVGLGVKF